ncbi:MAG: hypothetical protein WC427_02650 [Candidatus Paceibacterota bacterium]|jgi:predicted PurR-regulated permease PerM
METKLDPDKIKKPFWVIGALLGIGALVYVTIVSSFSLIDSFQNFSNNAPDLTPNSENYFLETEETPEIQENNLNQPGTENEELDSQIEKE